MKQDTDLNDARQANWETLWTSRGRWPWSGRSVMAPIPDEVNLLNVRTFQYSSR